MRAIKFRRLSGGPGLLGLQLNGAVVNPGALDDRDLDAELVPGTETAIGYIALSA